MVNWDVVSHDWDGMRNNCVTQRWTLKKAGSE